MTDFTPNADKNAFHFLLFKYLHSIELHLNELGALLF